MILADASVLIDYDRGTDAKLVAVVDALSVGVCGNTRSEVLAGARTRPSGRIAYCHSTRSFRLPSRRPFGTGWAITSPSCGRPG